MPQHKTQGLDAQEQQSETTSVRRQSSKTSGSVHPYTAEDVEGNRPQQEPKPPFPKQHQEKPGIESQLRPRPESQAPRYKGAAKLADKVALITGGDSGIGRATAVLFAREGADVAIVFLPEELIDAEQTIATFGQQTPMKRPAQPEEITPAFVLFASEADSSYVTGEVLALLGGKTTGA